MILALRTAALSLCLWSYATAASSADGDAEPNDDLQVSIDKPNAIAVYWGKTTENAFLEHLYQPWELRFVDSQVVALAYSRRVKTWGRHLHLELEGNVSLRYGEDNLWEIAGMAMFRYDGFPWNHVVYTSIGYAPFGLSYVTDVPMQENRPNGRATSKILNFMVPELTLAPPGNPNLEFLLRIHHRSGIFGTFNGVTGASNIVSVGLRYRY